MKTSALPGNYLEKIRNIGIIAHIDAGKTTLTERILFYAKKIHRMGEVHEGTATMDYLPAEQERGITIVSACTTCGWKDKVINIIDTPGHVDFTIEVDRALRVLDGVVAVFCAVGGVEPQSETVWKQSEKYHIPKIAFINKMDRIGASFEAVLEAMRQKLQVVPVPIQVPLGEGEDFKGVIDILRMQKLKFNPQDQGQTFERLPLDKEENEYALKWREYLFEHLAEIDDSVLESYLEGQEVSLDEVNRVLRKATLDLKLVPVLAGSALKNTGVQPALDAVCNYLPSPADVPQIEGIDPSTKEKKFFPISPKSPLSALAFKVTMETGRKLVLLRVYSGKIVSGQTVYNVSQKVEERVARLFRLHADHKEKIEEAVAGQIVAAAGLKNTKTGDTLCLRENPILLEKISEYKPVISMALEPKNNAEEEKLLHALDKVLQEDPTLFVERDKDTEQLIISGMGELHLEVVLDRIRKDFGVEFRAGQPQVVYQETIADEAFGEAEFAKELGEDVHYGYVRLMVEPLSRNSGREIRFEIDKQAWPTEWIEAVYNGIEDGLQAGTIKGFPVQDIRVVVLELKSAEQGSSPVGYRMAAVMALKEALSKAKPMLLEPIMWVEIYTPEEFVGECISLLGAKGGRIENMFDRHGQKIIQSLTPLRKMFGFSTDLRSVTQGRAALSMKFERFDTFDS
ncbi:elongation factor G [Desulfohalobiaceae bacterium Ax17]|uniref:elongation factor G n=1 Tax=Desulfovulcanus ferrireducens TaxID=2831190 RepID=UPI00207BA44E|nr:elongation factor G [Desulfovulcanus ferrireducens]MBT8764041.1 elongation factor G [Desulfovulcanus ferrireducens]